jgi:hypothetical protein
LHHNKKLIRRPDVLRFPVLKTDERIARQGHHLPENEEEPHHVRGAQQTVHRGEERQEMGIVSCHAVVRIVSHVDDGVERSRNRNNRCQQQEHRCQAIHMNA